MVEQFRSRPLDAGPYTFMWIDALTQKVREGGRTVNVHCLIATGVNAGGHREMASWARMVKLMCSRTQASLRTRGGSIAHSCLSRSTSRSTARRW
jgi:transposase-like protein